MSGVELKVSDGGVALACTGRNVHQVGPIIVMQNCKFMQFAGHKVCHTVQPLVEVSALVGQSVRLLKRPGQSVCYISQSVYRRSKSMPWKSKRPPAK